MIVLLDLCYEKDSLSRYEFIDPIEYAVRKAGGSPQVVHYSDLFDDRLQTDTNIHISSVTKVDSSESSSDFKVLKDRFLHDSEKIILCGTALKDFGYCDRIESFSWLTEYEKPVLGICAGMQVIASVFGGGIISQPSIGLFETEILAKDPLLGSPRVIEVYHLHSRGVTLPPDFSVLAGSKEHVVAFRHKSRPVYGILFHPEVRNRWILDRFVALD